MTTFVLDDNIISSDINVGFTEYEDALSWINSLDGQMRNLSFSFDGISTTPETLSSVEPESLTELFRASDDIQIMGFMVDYMGVDCMGININPGAASPPVNSPAIDLKITLKGNFTKLDEEEGYPVIYKSIEFNLISDIDYSFKEENAVGVFSDADVLENPLKRSGLYLTSDSVNPDDVTTPSRTFIGAPARGLFYPVDKNKEMSSLLRGAQYILTVEPTGSNDEYHDITALQLTIVCKHFKRRYT